MSPERIFAVSKKTLSPKLFLDLGFHMPLEHRGVGHLRAPERLIRAGKTIEDTGFKYGDHGSVTAICVGDTYSHLSRKTPCQFGIAEGKKPLTVDFDFSPERQSGESVLGHWALVFYYLGLGYAGSFAFVKEGKCSCCGDRNKIACQCSIEVARGSNHSSRIRLSWNERFGGAEEQIRGVVEVCRKSGLRELKQTSK